ncbi:MAG: hypothetical protein EOO13_13710 [Chitinophagaceae bacterium]|nr:MAG: hypothetical protein EOO13_13710 [Chitinophagaceae bacterium]
MSLRKTMLLLMASLCTYAGAIAQQTPQAKPSVFASYPSTFTISEVTLQKLFALAGSQEAIIDFGNNLVIPCKVIRNETRYANLQTIIIKTTAYNNAMMQVSKITHADRSITYTGRIINENAADGFEIKKTGNGSYQLQKFETDKILEGCFL